MTARRLILAPALAGRIRGASAFDLLPASAGNQPPLVRI